MMKRISGFSRARLVVSATVAGLLLTGCASRETPATDEPLGRVAVSTDGMVVSGSAEATRVGAEVLGSGGNAVDAAIATAFALAVVEPTQSGLGGRTQALARLPDGTALGVDATNAVPASYDPDVAPPADEGYGVVAVPGTVAGLVRLHEEAASLPLPELIAPAIALAEDGFALSEGEARRLAGIRERLASAAAGGSVFLRSDGTAWAAGDTLRQPALAEVLRAIADDGREVFYLGWVADRMAEDIAAGGGHVTRADLAAYEAEASIVVRGRYGSLDLLGTYVPASGATTIEALQILDRLDLGLRDPDARAFLVGQALAFAFADREAAWNDARPPAEDAAWITSDTLADRRAALLWSSGGAPAGDASAESPNTTHVSVLDRNGMAVAMTQSLGPTGGSLVATEGLGFLYAATVGGYLGYVRPGDRPWSSQSPLIALREGRPSLVMGGAGARRIISAMVHAVVRLETEGSSLEDALGAPRLHPAASAWTFERPRGSAGDPPGAALARRAGHEVEVRPIDLYFGRLNVIGVDAASGRMIGLADPRWTWGAASGPIHVR